MQTASVQTPKAHIIYIYIRIYIYMYISEKYRPENRWSLLTKLPTSDTIRHCQLLHSADMRFVSIENILLAQVMFRFNQNTKRSE